MNPSLAGIIPTDLPRVSFFRNWRAPGAVMRKCSPLHKEAFDALFHRCGPTRAGFSEPAPHSPIWFWGTGINCNNYEEFFGDPARPVFNSPKTSRRFYDKAIFYKDMRGQTMPPSATTPQIALALRFPIIAKRRMSNRGRGMVRFASADDLRARVAGMDKRTYLFQEAVTIAQEFRIFSFRGIPIYAFERLPRTAKGFSFRQGAATPLPASEEPLKFYRVPVVQAAWLEDPRIRAIARVTWERTGMDVHGLDIALDESGRAWLLEGNGGPGMPLGAIPRVYAAIMQASGMRFAPATMAALLDLSQLLETFEELPTEPLALLRRGIASEI